MATTKKLYSAYRPHHRVQELGEIVNPHTGDVTIPPSMTKQEFKRECDVNNVIKQYSTSGMLNHINAKASIGAYQDLPDSYDFQESLHVVHEAEKAFMTLPSKTRERFGNEPAEFLAFMSDPKNGDEMIKLGLRSPPPADRGGDGGTTPPVVSSETPKPEPTPKK